MVSKEITDYLNKKFPVLKNIFDCELHSSVFGISIFIYDNEIAYYSRSSNRVLFNLADPESLKQIELNIYRDLGNSGNKTII